MLLALASVLLLFMHGGQAGQEKYEYDPIGRLVRFVDSNNEVTEYSYDPAGNLLSVKRTSAAGLAPAIAAISPTTVRQGTTATLTITGERLATGTLQAPDAGLTLANVRLAATQILADLTVSPSAATGTQTLTFGNSLGTATVALLVAPRLPRLSVEPNPLALPPDNTPRQVVVRLSNADIVGHTVNVASSDAAKGTVSPASIAFAPGVTSAQVAVTPKASGFFNLVLTSPTLATATVPVFVTSDFRGVNTSQAPAVGVVVGEPTTPQPASTTATFAAPRVGVALGPVLTGVAPRGFAAGGSHALTVSGVNLPAGLQLSVAPSTGVSATITSSTAQQVSVALVADAAAAPGLRRLVFRDGTGKVVPYADESAAHVHLTTGQPEIHSVEPLFATAGTVPRLKVRGRNLHNGRLVVTPSIDLLVDAAPAVNADGTELVAGVAIAPLAAAGTRVAQVVTPSGQTSAQASVANQFTIVSQIRHDIAPIMAPLVGVRVGNSAPTQSTTTVGPVQSGVGVVVGAAAVSMTPRLALVGSTVALTVTGLGLDAVQAAALLPATGLTVGTPTVAAGGTSLTIMVGIAADAPRVVRRLVLTAAGKRLPFADPSGDQLVVVAPPPELVSVTPQVLAAGQTTTLTVRGRNFVDVQSVQFDPASGIVAFAPGTVSEGGTVLAVAVQVPAAAPTGPRTVIVTTPAGPSSSSPVPANTVQVAQQVGPTYATLATPLVGITVGASAPPQRTDTMAAYAPLVGLVVGSGPTQTTRTDSIHAHNVGVVVGTASTGMSPRTPDGFLKGTAGSVVVRGVGLDQVNAVAVIGTGVTAGTATPNADGTELTVPLTVTASAPSAVYGVRLRMPSGTATAVVPSAAPAAMVFSVGALPGSVDSMSPIVLEQGKTFSFTVRGTGLRDVYEVFAEPGAGLVFGAGSGAPQWSTDTLGEKLTVPLVVAPNATIGSRVVRLRVPGGATDAQATPNNTITIVAPQ
jgi:YD repeat-containing protein